MTQPLSGEPDPSASRPAPREPSRGLVSTTIAGVRDLMLSVVIAILVILFLYQPVKVEGTSMMPSLEDQERIFEKFQQVGDTLTDKPSGTGLGLAICRRIVGHFGGRLWVESEPGRGSVFSFDLPVAAGARGAERLVASA